MASEIYGIRACPLRMSRSLAAGLWSNGPEINLPSMTIEVAERRPSTESGSSPGGRRVGPRLFPWFDEKRRQALTFLATFENDHRGMNTLAVISILALLTISGAAYTDQIRTGDRQTAQRAN